MDARYHWERTRRQYLTDASADQPLKRNIRLHSTRLVPRKQFYDPAGTRRKSSRRAFGVGDTRCHYLRTRGKPDKRRTGVEKSLSKSIASIANRAIRFGYRRLCTFDDNELRLAAFPNSPMPLFTSRKWDEHYWIPPTFPESRSG